MLRLATEQPSSATEKRPCTPFMFSGLVREHVNHIEIDSSCLAGVSFLNHCVNGEHLGYYIQVSAHDSIEDQYYYFAFWVLHIPLIKVEHTLKEGESFQADEDIDAAARWMCSEGLSQYDLVQKHFERLRAR